VLRVADKPRERFDLAQKSAIGARKMTEPIRVYT